jgi:hypothetical protein
VDIPSALSALTHCIYGSIAASLWRDRLPESEAEG